MPKIEWGHWLTIGLHMGMSPRDVFDLAPNTFVRMMQDYAPAKKPGTAAPSRRKMQQLMRIADGRP